MRLINRWRAIVRRGNSIRASTRMKHSKVSFALLVLQALSILPTLHSLHLEDAPILPDWIDPSRNMVVNLKDWPAQSSINSYNQKSDLPSGSIILPSVYCLLSSTELSEIPAGCLDGLDRGTPGMQLHCQELYAESRTDPKWRAEHPTLYSFLLVATSQQTSISEKRNGTPRIELRSYEQALQLMGVYIMLPLMAKYGGLTDQVIFVAPAPPESNFARIFSKRSGKTLRGCNFVVALNNPMLWHLPMNLTDPYSVLIPNLRPDDPYAIDMAPLTSDFNDAWFHENIGKDWDPRRYKTRGLFFISVLRELIQHSVSTKSIIRGYEAKLLWDYVLSINVLVSSVTVPSDYVFMQTNRPLKFPAWFSPTENLVVTVNAWPNQSFIIPYEPSSHDLQQGSSRSVVLPSIYCLQLPPDMNLLPEICRDAIDNHESIVKKLWAKSWAKFSTNKNRHRVPSTLIEFLYGMLAEMEPTMSNTDKYMFKRVDNYLAALKLIGFYIMLPLIADYRGINSEIVWLVCDEKNLTRCSMETTRPIETNDNSASSEKRSFILPLSNPRLWHLPVNERDPYSIFLPKNYSNELDNEYTKPLMTILNDEWFIKNVDEHWNPMNYKTRGLFLLGVLSEITSRVFDHHLYEACEITIRYNEAFSVFAFYNSVPADYINGNIIDDDNN